MPATVLPKWPRRIVARTARGIYGERISEQGGAHLSDLCFICAICGPFFFLSCGESLMVKVRKQLTNEFQETVAGTSEGKKPQIAQMKHR